MKARLAASLLFAVVVGCQHAPSPEVVHAPGPESPEVVRLQSVTTSSCPEDIVRAVAFAVAVGDHATIRRLTWNAPDRELILSEPVADARTWSRVARECLTMPLEPLISHSSEHSYFRDPKGVIHVVVYGSGYTYDPTELIAQRRASINRERR
jgi:hypothetical protein